MKELRQFTTARVGLGRAGNSVPTREMLDFQLAHARARDAVHFPLDSNGLRREMEADGWTAAVVKSAARDRAEYLRRPDLGRCLDIDSRGRLDALSGNPDSVFVIADGLSALAVHRHALALLQATDGAIGSQVVIVEQGRVAIGDEIGEILRASLVVVLIGERPGLSSPDSLGVYLTWNPRVGKIDAERNCISNIRSDGLSPVAAGVLLAMLMRESRARRLSGISLRVPGPLELKSAE
ncbi:MAG TPA: ethanolamine ammonia-lyase subunit EutC [Bryobacteraceae bacterium]|jgi:ethanolamine ammonia-lyase small subunit|nr:ethanolamine ammonia-lyase subunit EutC [Bryobacteraceae bacterium]